MDRLAESFESLDRWRHLPAYQLERRADIFFSPYLREVVHAFTGVPLHETMLPELPLRKGVLWDNLDDNKSVKVDFALIGADLQRVFLVELKTDVASRRGAQDAYLKQAAEIGFGKIVEGVVQLACAARMNRTHLSKYYHLLLLLEDLGFVELPGDLETFVYAENRTGLTRKLQEIVVAALDPPITVLYLQPTNTAYFAHRDHPDRSIVIALIAAS